MNKKSSKNLYSFKLKIIFYSNNRAFNDTTNCFYPTGYYSLKIFK